MVRVVVTVDHRGVDYSSSEEGWCQGDAAERRHPTDGKRRSGIPKGNACAHERVRDSLTIARRGWGAEITVLPESVVRAV